MMLLYHDTERRREFMTDYHLLLQAPRDTHNTLRAKTGDNTVQEGEGAIAY